MSRSRETKLQAVIFTDGRIDSYSSTPEGLTVMFCDCAGNLLELLFSGDVKFEDHLCEPIFPAGSRLVEGERSRLELLDDDKNIEFSVDFGRCKVRFTDQPEEPMKKSRFKIEKKSIESTIYVLVAVSVGRIIYSIATEGVTAKGILQPIGLGLLMGLIFAAVASIFVEGDDPVPSSSKTDSSTS